MVLTSETCIGGEIKNISPSGAFVHCFTAPQQGQEIRLVFRDTERNKLLAVAAELAWSNILDYDDVSASGIGVRFKEVLSYEQLFLNGWPSQSLRVSA
jgi:Tfp pilus assembly protein PilZ